ncbi:MAG: HDOD domain-containing protein [Pseudomonadota bacterium]
MTAPMLAPQQQPDSVDAVHVARQPIYDRDLKVYAYEILFRTAEGVCAIESGDDATQEVVSNALIDIGLDRLVGSARAFINLTTAYITGERALPYVGERVVLEVLEDVPPTPEVIAGLEKFAADGHTVALDDFIDRPECEPMLHIAHIVKLDLMAIDPADLEAQVNRLRQFNVKLLAEKVETHEEFRRCLDLGFDYFQGYFFCKPDQITGVRPKGNKLIATELMSALQKPDIGFDDLQSILSRDASLAYRLLGYVNSAYFNFRSQVESIRQALTIIGTRGVKQWATMILMSTLGQGKPNELLRMGMIRARMCENLADRVAGVSPDALFTCGLFSILDALMDMTMEDVVETMAVDDLVTLALLKGQGPLGQVLGYVMAYEQGALNALPEDWAKDCQRAYIDAVEWSQEFDSAVKGGI